MLLVVPVLTAIVYPKFFILAASFPADVQACLDQTLQLQSDTTRLLVVAKTAKLFTACGMLPYGVVLETGYR
jgi:hypothetical protein